MTTDAFRIGIDLGGTKVEGVILGADGLERARRRVPTPRDYLGTVDAIVTIVRELEAQVELVRPASVGVGIPGAVTPETGLVKNANSVWLIGKPLRDDLAQRLGREVRMQNDADCFALSEASDGAGAGAPTVFGVILGTGVGGGVVVSGHAIQGPNLITGEWGHNPLPWPRADELPGPLCYCGKHGCVESWLSGPGFERDFVANGGAARRAVDIVDAAFAGDALGSHTLERYHDRLARALASIINVLDPYVIVLGGGMSNTPGLADAVTTRLPAWVFSDTVLTRVVRNQHGDSSGVRGAAWLWPLTA